MSFRYTYPTITVIRQDGTSAVYTYYQSYNVGYIRKGDALAINEGKATAFYTDKPHLTFTSAKYYHGGKKWFLKSERKGKKRA